MLKTKNLMCGSLAVSPPNNSEVLTANISIHISFKEFKSSRITHINQVFRLWSSNVHQNAFFGLLASLSRFLELEIKL